MVAILAGLATVGVAVYVGSRLWAQTPAATAQTTAAAAPAQIRVAVVNLFNVMQNYNKAKFYETELKRGLLQYKQDEDKINAEITKAQKTLETPKLADKDREAWDKYMVAQRRALEDLKRKTNKELAGKQL